VRQAGSLALGQIGPRAGIEKGLADGPSPARKVKWPRACLIYIKPLLIFELFSKLNSIQNLNFDDFYSHN
jgi:hypothetical protein